jgi:hypothetical protein
LVAIQCKVGKSTNTLVGPAFTIIIYHYQELFAKEQENVAREKKKLQKQKEIIVDVNAIMMENKKKKKGASSRNPSKVITKVSLPQEGDVSKFVANVDKPIAASNVVNKVIKVAIGEDQSFNNVDIEQTLEVKML